MGGAPCPALALPGGGREVEGGRGLGNEIMREGDCGDLCRGAPAGVGEAATASLSRRPARREAASESGRLSGLQTAGAYSPPPAPRCPGSGQSKEVAFGADSAAEPSGHSPPWPSPASPSSEAVLGGGWNAVPKGSRLSRPPRARPPTCWGPGLGMRLPLPGRIYPPLATPPPRRRTPGRAPEQRLNSC